jgi:hypothetical protein
LAASGSISSNVSSSWTFSLPKWNPSKLPVPGQKFLDTVDGVVGDAGQDF